MSSKDLILSNNQGFKLVITKQFLILNSARLIYSPTRKMCAKNIEPSLSKLNQ